MVGTRVQEQMKLMDRPKPGRVTMNMRVNEDFKNAVDQWSSLCDTTMTSFITVAVGHYIKYLKEEDD